MEYTLAELMTLGRARIELENRNFTTLLDNDDTLVCLKTDCRWIFCAKFDVLVVVNDIRATGGGTLDLARILVDVANVTHYYDAKMDVGCPPHGFSQVGWSSSPTFATRWKLLRLTTFKKSHR
jgi:hypothetical protein